MTVDGNVNSLAPADNTQQKYLARSPCILTDHDDCNGSNVVVSHTVVIENDSGNSLSCLTYVKYPRCNAGVHNSQT
jgi:hypothetical protein